MHNKCTINAQQMQHDQWSPFKMPLHTKTLRLTKHAQEGFKLGPQAHHCPKHQGVDHQRLLQYNATLGIVAAAICSTTQRFYAAAKPKEDGIACDIVQGRCQHHGAEFKFAKTSDKHDDEYAQQVVEEILQRQWECQCPLPVRVVVMLCVVTQGMSGLLDVHFG